MSGYDGARLKTTGGPRFAMVGIDKPDGGCLLYASRDLPQDKLLWGVANDRYGTATGWHIDAEMRNVLIIDKRTWGEAFARLFEIWGNWDRNDAIEAAQQANREHALKSGQAGEVPGWHYSLKSARHAGARDTCELCARVTLPRPATARALAESGTETLEDPPGMQVLIPGFSGEKAPEKPGILDVRQVAIVDGKLAELRSHNEAAASRDPGDDLRALRDEGS